MRAAAVLRRMLPLVVFACGLRSAAAQHLPVQGCHGAIPCSDREAHRGFGDQYLSQGDGNTFFITEASFGRGLDLRLVTAKKEKGPPDPVEESVKVFVARHPFLARPVPLPQPEKRAPEAPSNPSPKSH